MATTLKSKDYVLCENSVLDFFVQVDVDLRGLLTHSNNRNVKAGLRSVLKGSILLQQAVRLVILA